MIASDSCAPAGGVAGERRLPLATAAASAIPIGGESNSETLEEGETEGNSVMGLAGF